MTSHRARSDRELAEDVLRKLNELRAPPATAQIKELAILAREVRRSPRAKTEEAHRATVRLWELLAAAPRVDIPALWEDAIGKTDDWCASAID
jgi:hypothetical protein